DLRQCTRNAPGSTWGRCCLNPMCGNFCCPRSGCTCAYNWRRGIYCSC
uniref:Alpha-conotoxin VxXXC n=1 Tax=Conus vexillum TaxID=89431 RepID=CDKC_CONVX|nr:RecName: Full=Alpha-conotoxin VxXXC; AltName: Full=VxXIIC [Conus vexillum]